MASSTTGSPRSQAPPEEATANKTLPIHPSPKDNDTASQGDPMEISHPDGDSSDLSPKNSGRRMKANNESGAGSSSAQTAATSRLQGSTNSTQQQPKVVQTAFIHKLYNMLEDSNIQHLITWSSSGESFLISPTNEFAKALSSYFKHTNVSSFVRQLNMYGFHKVSDVFHTGNPESPLWEFKHGNGNFKRGDLAGLKEIKRRASRHALIHRDSFAPAPKTQSVSVAPAAEPMPDPLESRLQYLEQSLYDAHRRLAQTEESLAFTSHKYHSLSENMMKCYQYNHSLSSYLMANLPNNEAELRRNVQEMQMDINRHLETLRNFESTQPPPRTYSFANTRHDPREPASPMQLGPNDRRGSLPVNPRNGPRHPPPFGLLDHQPHNPPGGQFSTFRAHEANPSPRTGVPPPPTFPSPSEQQQGYENSQQPGPPTGYLLRRHTSAEIRPHEWPPQAAQPEQPAQLAPFTSGPSSAQWPSSPFHTPDANAAESQQLRDTLSRFQFGGAGPRHFSTANIPAPQSTVNGSRHPTPPPHAHPGSSETTPSRRANGVLDPSQWPGGGARPLFKDNLGSSNPPTRRSSVAHLLNPSDSTGGDEDEDVGPDEVRKRKRVG